VPHGKSTEHPSAPLLGDARYPGVIEMKFFLQPAGAIVKPAEHFFDWRSSLYFRAQHVRF
jgi:hypothetical protein